MTNTTEAQLRKLQNHRRKLRGQVLRMQVEMERLAVEEQALEAVIKARQKDDASRAET